MAKFYYLNFMEIKEEFYAYGHELIQATHKTTLEITKDDHLTKRGNCIIAIKSEKACADLSPELKKIIKKDGSKVIIKIYVNNFEEIIEAEGSSKLILTSKNSIVIRKSDYIDERTLAIRANKASADLDRNLIKCLRSANSKVKIEIKAYVKDEKDSFEILKEL
jgi:hypothetical protein